MEPSEGFHYRETDVWGPFVWTKRRFTVRRAPEHSFFLGRLCFLGDHGALEIAIQGERVRSVPLSRGWKTYALDFSGIDGNEITFVLTHLSPSGDDPRELGIMIRRVRPLAQRGDYDMVRSALAERVLNDREFAEGSIRLDSVAQQLSLSLSGECNIAPRCVYCDWDQARTDERDSVFRSTAETLDQFGAFYRRAERVGELSIGEPLLNPDFGALVERFHRHGKVFSLTTNGQMLDRTRRRFLHGKDIELFVSLESADSDSYARIRNDRFDVLMENLRARCSERRSWDNRPNVVISYTAMRSILSEFPRVLDLVKDIGVDGIRIMSLDPLQRLLTREESRSGFAFRYHDECLSWPEVEHFVRFARELAATRGVPVFSLVEFNHEDVLPDVPLCSEPWKIMNATNRGIVRCCFDKAGLIARWSERGERTLEQFLFDVWNGRTMTAIRTKLARHEFPDVCMQAGACPLVRREFELSGRHRVRQRNQG